MRFMTYNVIHYDTANKKFSGSHSLWRYQCYTADVQLGSTGFLLLHVTSVARSKQLQSYEKKLKACKFSLLRLHLLALLQKQQKVY